MASHFNYSINIVHCIVLSDPIIYKTIVIFSSNAQRLFSDYP